MSQEALGSTPEEIGLEGSQEKEKEKPIDALVVFGGGILSDESYKVMGVGKGLMGHPEQGWRLPLGAKLRVLGAAELYLGGQVEDVILTGGPVAVKAGIESSEAQLMKKYFQHKIKERWNSQLKREFKEKEGELSADRSEQVDKIVQQRLEDSERHILLEDKATNTIENFAHTINFLERDKTKYQNIALLSNSFHTARIVKLADKFGISGKGIGAEPIVSQVDPRYKKIAERYFDPEINAAYREEVLSALSEEERPKYEARLGGSVEASIKGERRWSRGLDEIPEYWLPNVKFIQNPDQLKNILKAEQDVQRVLREGGIEDIDAASEAEIREALDKIERKMPPVEWEEETNNE